MFGVEINNPFQYLSPERIDAKTAVDMFVDVFKDYYQVLNAGHTFIHGARGSGKSMMFRIMKSDCQTIMLQKALHELPFYAIYIPVKDTSLNISELAILDKKHGGVILNEHLLSLYVSICIFNTLAKETFDQTCSHDSFELYNYVVNLVKAAGYQGEVSVLQEGEVASKYFQALVELCTVLLDNFSVHYLSRLAVSGNLSYNGPLCLYQNFLLHIIRRIRTLSFLPDSPLYFLVDDADELNETQTKILNTWVSYRSTQDVCFKISTQLRYLTYFTTRGSKIDAPHDYFEVTLNQVYTSESKNRYLTNVREIVEKRLKLCGINVTADKFFPSNKNQEEAISALVSKIREQQVAIHGDERKAYDYAYRNARPDYMTKVLTNKYTYSYAGFEQLAHLSSGIIRLFLDLAARMYTSACKRGDQVTKIPVGVQDEEIRKYSQYFFISEFDKVIGDKCIIDDEESISNHKKLQNFIEAIGQSFNAILKSNSSERRKFSFYYEGQLPNDLMKILKLGEKYGYFHGSTIGSKSGLGRSRLFVLNRMLAPYYDLDPFSFSGYLHLTHDMIRLGMMNPQAFIKRIKDKEYRGDLHEPEYQQLVLDFFNPEGDLL